MLDTTRHHTAPFDTALLDRLMDEAGVDVLVATSKRNVQCPWWPSLVLFRQHGRDRDRPLSAGFRLSERRAEKAAYFGHGVGTFRPKSSRSGSPK